MPPKTDCVGDDFPEFPINRVPIGNRGMRRSIVLKLHSIWVGA